MKLNPDTILNGRYRILRVLSDKGGMGMIYQAHDQNLSGTVVIKESRFTEQALRQEYPNLPVEQVRRQAELLRKAFESEAKLLYGLRHNGLPRVIDYFATPDERQFFVMEFIPGKDFSDLLHERLQQRQGPFPLAQVAEWAGQMFDVLHYLHTAFDPPIIHRDIKPLNLKLMPNGQVVLLDFGLAKGARPGMSVVKSLLAGTPHYAPLEQLNRKANQEQQTDPRSDIYSLAVTLHQLLTGEVPPDAVDRVQAAALGEPDPLRPVHESAPAIAESFSLALHCAAAVFAKDRPASVAELRRMLRQPVTPEPRTVFVTPPPIVQPKPAPPVVRPQPAAPQPYSEDLGNGVKLEMLAIPGGSFLMGSPDGEGYDDEHPQHRVTVAPFYLGKFQVTQVQWQAVMNSNPSHFKSADLPVESVSWNDAVKFCEAISQRTGKKYRLPSEAEWEYACRAGANGKYCFGDDEALLGEYAWYGGNAERQTHPVGRKKPNAWGLYDMHGNVWEWCEDVWHDSYGGQHRNPPTDGSAWLSGGDSSFRVLRGGSWVDYVRYCRSAYRDRSAPGDRLNNIGFRVAVSARTL